MEIEVRRIQRVGTSSLVVTIPKEWARRLNLEPGSQVMLIDEGDSIRVKPVSGNEEAAIELDLSRVPGDLASSTPLCIYLSPITEADVLFPTKKSLEDAKTRSLYLMGLQIYDMMEGDKARVEILLDSSKIDVSKLLRTLTVSVRESASLLLRVLRGEREGIREKTNIVRTQFLRTHYIVLRYLTARYSERGGIENYQVTLSTSYAGFAIDLLQELVLTSTKVIRNGVPEGDLEGLTRIIEGIEKSGDLLFRTLALPSVKRLADLYRELYSTRALAEEMMVNSESREAAVISGKLHDIIRLLMISSYVAVCRVIVGVASLKQ